MADKPLTEVILSTIETRLKAINKANGYSRDVDADNIHRRLEWDIGETVPMPSIFIFVDDIEEQPDRGSVGAPLVTMPIFVLYLVEERSTPAVAANEMSADITKAIGDDFEATDVDGKAGMVKIVRLGRKHGVAEGDQSVVYVSVGYEVIFEYKWGDEARFA